MRYLHVYQTSGDLQFYHHDCYESRCVSLEQMIRDAVKTHNITKDFRFTVGADDRPEQQFNFSTMNKQYHLAFPDFNFQAWPEVGIQSYTQLIESYVNTTPETNKAGWIGVAQSESRRVFVEQHADTEYSEAVVNNWIRSGDSDLSKTTPTYMSYQQQIDRWKYLIDFEGAGYSGRTKMLLHTPRIVFIVDRPYEEFWYEHIEPWKHYVPVARDLSDLKENHEKIESDVELQAYIHDNQKQFAQKYLTRTAALEQISRMINAL